MTRQETVLNYLTQHGIPFSCYNHPEGKTVEEAMRWWRDDGSVHCKNLFLRNHKGDRHYLVILHCTRSLAIRDLEQRLRQGKLSFASPQRMERYLGLRPGSVSPFGLVNDTDHHVHVFLDENLRSVEKLSFHPNDNRASLSIRTEDFIRFMDSTGNTYEWVKLY